MSFQKVKQARLQTDESKGRKGPQQIIVYIADFLANFFLNFGDSAMPTGRITEGKTIKFTITDLCMHIDYHLTALPSSTKSTSIGQIAR